MNYDTMTVHELVNLLVDIDAPVIHRVGIEETGDIESALRKAVVRGASVGIGTVRRAGEQPLPDAPQMFVPWKTKDGDYDLIPKETHEGGSIRPV